MSEFYIEYIIDVMAGPYSFSFEENHTVVAESLKAAIEKVYQHEVRKFDEHEMVIGVRLTIKHYHNCYVKDYKGTQNLWNSDQLDGWLMIDWVNNLMSDDPDWFENVDTTKLPDQGVDVDSYWQAWWYTARYNFNINQYTTGKEKEVCRKHQNEKSAELCALQRKEELQREADMEYLMQVWAF